MVLLSKPEGVSVKTWPMQKDGKAIQYEASLPDTSATSPYEPARHDFDMVSAAIPDANHVNPG
jgi:hypothetical protein